MRRSGVSIIAGVFARHSRLSLPTTLSRARRLILGSARMRGCEILGREAGRAHPLYQVADVAEWGFVVVAMVVTSDAAELVDEHLAQHAEVTAVVVDRDHTAPQVPPRGFS